MTAAVDPLVAPLRDNCFLIEQIANITGRNRSEVERRFKSEHRDIGGNVRRAMDAAIIEPYKWGPELEAFYADTDAFLYETLVWNRSGYKNDMRRWIGDHLARRSQQPVRVLSYGDGLGIDAYYLAQCGHEVTYFDVSQPCAEFAERIFQYGGVTINMITDPARLADASFDAILCLDVLEHVPDPAALVGWLSTLLQSQGELIVHAPFHCVHRAVPTHLRSNRRFSGDWKSIYQVHGLHPNDGRVFWNPLVLRKAADIAPVPVPWQVTLGGLLLKAGRYWAGPHNLVGKLLQDKKKTWAMVEAPAA